MKDNKKILPWDEIVDRLYHRQDAETIIKDLIERKIITDDEDTEYVSEIIEGMRSKVESYRLKSNE